MKKVITVIFTTLVVFSSLCAAPKKSKSLSLEPIEFDLPTEKGNEFSYAIDPRIEVVGTICRLAGYECFSQNYGGGNAFLSQMDTLFVKYKEHKAVKAIQNYRDQKKIQGDAWLNLAYHIKPDFSGTVVDLDPYPVDLNPELKKLTAKQLNALISLIHDFAVDTNFLRICALNRGTYVSDFGWMKEDIEKVNISTWGNDFFKLSDFNEVIITVSRLGAGYHFYDFVTEADGNRKAYVTIYPGIYYSNVVMCYSSIYTQLYANKYWDEVKDNFTRYLKDFSKKASPENAKEIEKEEIYSNSLASVLSMYCYVDYCKYKAEIQTPEDIEKYGDYKQAVDSMTQYLEKSFGNSATKAIELVSTYQENREKYKTIYDFSGELNAYLNTLKVE